MILREERRSVYRAVVRYEYIITPNREYMVPTIVYLENNKVSVDVDKLFKNRTTAVFSIKKLLLSCYGENAKPLKETLNAISATFANRPNPYWHTIDFTWSTDYFEEVPVGRINIKLPQNLI